MGGERLAVGSGQLAVISGGLGVEGRFDGEAAEFHNVGVDHGGFDVFVAEEFLDGSDIVAGLEEVGGEGVAEGVGGDVFVDFCEAGGFLDGALNGGFVDVVAADDALTPGRSPGCWGGE